MQANDTFSTDIPKMSPVKTNSNLAVFERKLEWLADLRRGKTDPVLGPHCFDHVIDKPAQGEGADLVRFDVARDLTQPRVADLQYRSSCHCGYRLRYRASCHGFLTRRVYESASVGSNHSRMRAFSSRA